MVLRFKYRSMERPQPLGPKSCPMIPIRFTGSAGAFDTAALLDSGADFTVIFEDHAQILGIDLSKLEETDVNGIGGAAKARKTRVSIEVKGKGEHRPFRMDVPCMILKRHAENFPILLGRAGFFEQFEVTFKEKDKAVVLKPEA